MRERLVDAYVTGAITDKTLFQRKLNEIEGRIENARVREKRVGVDPEIVQGLVERLEDYWPRLTVDEKRQILVTVTPRIVVTTGRTATAEVHSPLIDKTITVSNFHPRGRLRL